MWADAWNLAPCSQIWTRKIVPGATAAFWKKKRKKKSISLPFVSFKYIKKSSYTFPAQSDWPVTSVVKGSDRSARSGVAWHSVTTSSCLPNRKGHFWTDRLIGPPDQWSRLFPVFKRHQRWPAVSLVCVVVVFCPQLTAIPRHNS